MRVSPWIAKHARVFGTMDEAVSALRTYLAESCAWRPVYLAGPINGCTDEECRGWRDRATSALSHPVKNPMARDYRGVEAGNEDSIVDGDLADIKACSAVLANAVRPSHGTDFEMCIAAREFRMPVFAFVESP